ncbi:hypothetical protein Tco_1247274 [Tanacetum coccineum]
MIKKCSNPTSAISNETIANPNAQIVGDDMVRVQVPRCMAWLDYDEHVDSLSTMDNEVGVTIPKSTTQTLPLFEEYTPPVTYPKEVEKTLRTPIEVEPLNETKLEEVDLNCNHNTPLSSREVLSFDGPEPQPLLNSPSLDEMFDDDWGLESKEVSPLGEEHSLFDRPNEVERGVEEDGDLSLEAMEDEEVALVDGVFESAFGALRDEWWCVVEALVGVMEVMEVDDK